MGLVTFFILVLGILTVVLSIYAACKFYSYRSQLGRDASFLTNAISWQLLGEAVIGLGTLIFSIAAFLGVLPNWPTEVQSLIRFFMFFATSITTVHLIQVLHRIER